MMPTTIVAAQRSFDELIEQMGRKATMAEIESRKVEPGERERIQQWLAGMVKRTIDYLRVETEPPVPTDEMERLFGARLDTIEPRPTFGADAEDAISTHGENVAAILAMESLSLTARSEVLDYYRWTRRRWRQLALWAWPERKWLAYEGQFYRTPTDDPPDDELLQFLGAIEAPTNAPALPSGTHPRATVFKDGSARASSNLVMLGTIAALHNGHHWVNRDDGRPYYDYRTKDNEVEYMLDVPGVDPRFGEVELPAQDLEILQKYRQQLSPLDVDVMFAIDAHILQSARDDGAAWIYATDILGYRGIAVQPRPAGQRAPGSYRREDIDPIAASVEHLNHIYVKMGIVDAKGKGKRRKLIVHESKFLRIDDRHTQFTMDGKPVSVGWLCRHGTWRAELPESYRKQIAVVMKTILSYDPYHEPWEKKIGQYIVLQQRVSAGKARPRTLKIGTILDRTGLPLEGMDTRNPQRVKDRFDKAHLRLVADGVFSSDYDPDTGRPARNWLGNWLDTTITFTPPAPVIARYSVIAATAAASRERAARDTAKQAQKRGKS